MLNDPVAPPTVVVASIRTPFDGTTTLRTHAVRPGQASLVGTTVPAPSVTTMKASKLAESWTSSVSPVLAFTE